MKEREAVVTMASASGRRLAIDLGLSLGLSVVYFLLARIGTLFSVHSAHVSFVWLPAGLALAALLAGGPRLILGVALGTFAAEYSDSGALLPALAIAFGSSASAFAGAWVLQRRLSFSRSLEHPRHLLMLIGVGAFAAPILAATIGTSVMFWSRQFQWGEWPPLWATWWAADALGVLLLTPLLLAWPVQRAGPPTRPAALALSALQLAVGVCVFMLHTPAGVYVYLTLAVIGAMHVPLTGVMLINLLTFSAAALGVLVGVGPFTGPSLLDSLTILQTYGVVSAVAALLVSMLTAERAQAEAQRHRSLERFQQLTALSADWYWEQDENLRFTQLAGRAVEEGQIDVDSLLGRTSLEIETLDVPPEGLEKHDRAVAQRQPYHDIVITRRTRALEPRLISVSGAPIFDDNGKFQGYRGTARDITEHRLAQQHIARLKDMYAAMSEANSVIIHSTAPQELFESICKVAVDYVHFAFASIALSDGQVGAIRVVASAVRADFAAPAEQTRPIDEAMAERALRAGISAICNDISAEPRIQPWRDALAALGIRSFATLLLRRQGWIIGTLHMYANQTGVFDEELVGLLEKLALNLSFALDNFQREDARRDAESALRDSETRFRDFAHAAGEYVWETDLEGRFTYVSSRVQSVWGFSEQELIGHKAADFMPPGEAERVAEWLRDNTSADDSFRDLEHMIVTRNGDTRWLLNNAVAMFRTPGDQTGWRGTGRDVTDRKSAEARISYLATRDPLTELPNRVLFNDRLEQGIVAARRTGQSLALLFIDLDRFKNINDSLGHQVGDQLLKQVAARMMDCIRKGDTLSRLGGDEFVVTLEGLQQAEDGAQVASKIIKALSRPFEIGIHTLNTSCSIGISIFPLDADDERALMKNADTAMYHAKEKGRNNYQFFSPEMNTRAVERHTLETALRQAIEHQQFKLYYQPLVDMYTGKVVGVEALLRWDHPQRGLLAPGTFIAVAEESGLIEPIGQWVLRTACQRAKAWQDAGYPPLKLAVNISARQLIRPREFARGLSRVLSATGLEPRYLELEMTESLLIQNAEENIAVLRKLGQDGMRIAVDDFGTGYSSLSYLRQLPIDTLKIDRSFVRDIESDPEDAAIIQAIVAMAHSLGLQVTAEGVESRGQLEALSRLGCDEYQGYLFSRPLPAVELAARFLAPGVLDFEAASAKRREVGT